MHAAEQSPSFHRHYGQYADDEQRPCTNPECGELTTEDRANGAGLCEDCAAAQRDADDADPEYLAYLDARHANDIAAIDADAAALIDAQPMAPARAA